MARSAIPWPEATGYEIEFTAVTSRTAAVEAMRAKQVDFVLTGPAEYVVFKKRSEAGRDRSVSSAPIISP